MIKKLFILTMALMVWLTATVFAAEDLNPYTYVSQDNDFRINCPKRPNVVPASVFFDDNDRKGDVLIFENDGYEVKRGWVVLVNAFNSNAVPDFNRASKELINQYMTELKKQGYEEMNLINITNDNKGILATTAKEVEVDEDGDGKIDGVAINQAMIAFFRMPYGRCFSVQLIGTNELDEKSINDFKAALSTISEGSIENQSANHKQDKKSKANSKDKKSKKDKKK